MTIFILALILILLAVGVVFEAVAARFDPHRLSHPGRLVDAGGLRM